MTSTPNRLRRRLSLGQALEAVRTVRWLERRRPRPRSAFVGDLRDQLTARVAAIGRPPRLRLRVAGLIGGGVALLVLAVIIAAS